VLAAIDELSISGTWQVSRKTSAHQVYEALFSDEIPRAEAELFKKYDSQDAAVFTTRPRRGFELREKPLSHESRSALGEYEALLQRHHARPQLMRQMSCDEVFVEPNVDDGQHGAVGSVRTDESDGRNSVSSVDQLRRRSLSRAASQ
jgi:hypothetical protein